MSRQKEKDRIQVEIQKTDKCYFYCTKEKIRKCPKCGQEYISMKVCKQCWMKKKERIPTIIHYKQTEGRISLDLKEYNCTCLFGSFFRWAGYWRKVRPAVVCKHYKWALTKIKQMKGGK